MRHETDPPDGAIHAEGLVKTYPKDVRALDGLSFDVATGTVFGLLGPNGAGKSTAVKILTTLSRPTQGQARVAGHDVVHEPEAVRRLIGCVAQRSAVDKQATGRENLLLQGTLYGMRGPTLGARADELLDRFGLAAVSGRAAGTYSGGMQRKLDVAMGLVHRPRVLFLDEPTTGLDPEARAELWEEIARLTVTESMTILLTTHYLDEADRLAARVAIVDRGRIVAEGTPDQLKAGLRGDAVHVELAQPHPAALAAVAEAPGVRDVTLDGRTLRARADAGALAVPLVLAALDRVGVAAVAVTVARPTLDDVYLHYAGRSLAAAEEVA